MKEEGKEAVFGPGCNYCGSHDDLREDPLAPGLLVCHSCRERFEMQEEMIRQGYEIQPEIE